MIRYVLSNVLKIFSNSINFFNELNVLVRALVIIVACIPLTVVVDQWSKSISRSCYITYQ